MIPFNKGIILFLTTVFFVILVKTNITSIAETIRTSEMQRTSDIGNASAELLETAAVNNMERALDPNFKTQGISVISEFRNDQGILFSNPHDIKEEIKRLIESEFRENTKSFNRRITDSQGNSRDLYTFTILNPIVNLGQVPAEFDGYNQFSNNSLDARDPELFNINDYGSETFPYYKATLRINFRSQIGYLNKREELDRETMNQNRTGSRDSAQILDFPIFVDIRHINRDNDNYVIN